MAYELLDATLANDAGGGYVLRNTGTGATYGTVRECTGLPGVWMFEPNMAAQLQHSMEDLVAASAQEAAAGAVERWLAPAGAGGTDGR